MNTAGGNDARHEWEKWLDALKEQAARDGASLRDPSVRDVLAQLDRIETKLDTLLELLEPKPLTPGYHGQYGSVPCA